MYCTQCGAENAEGNKICSKCGAALTTTASPTATAQPTLVTQKTSGFAIASLVLGIIGILLNFLCVLTIIFGAIALAQIGKNPALKGKGIAIAGLVLGILVLIIWIVAIVWIGSSLSYLF
jgi:uncharacterized membrane protein YvbJ